MILDLSTLIECMSVTFYNWAALAKFMDNSVPLFENTYLEFKFGINFQLIVRWLSTKL